MTVTDAKRPYYKPRAEVGGYKTYTRFCQRCLQHKPLLGGYGNQRTRKWFCKGCR